MKRIGWIIIFAFVITLSANAEKDLKLVSPNGVHEVIFRQKQISPEMASIQYSVSYNNKQVLTNSQAGIDMDNRVWKMALGLRKIKQPNYWMDNFEVDSVSYQPQVDKAWHFAYGERSNIRDCYNGATMYLSKKDGSNYRLNIEVRAYNEGIAFRYFLPEHPLAVFHKVVKDLTEYTFPQGTMAWVEEWAQATFNHVQIKDIQRPVERALTLELPNGLWVALTDADVDDWCLTKFQASTQKENTLVSVMYSPVDVVTYYATPWKIIMTAEKPGELLENNDIVLNLNPLVK